MHTLATFVAGGTNVFVPRVDAELLCRTIETERCTGAFLVGPMFDADPRGERRRWLRPVEPAQRAGSRRVGRDGQPGHEPVGRAPRRLRPDRGRRHDDVQLPRARCARARTGGPLRCVEIRIVDDDDREVPPGEVGEIVVRGVHRHERLLEPARRERGPASGAAGTTRTTSAGARPTARSRFIGPKTRMIKSAAENIYPAEVEGCIAPAPGRRRVRGDRRPRRQVGAEREGDRRDA